MPFEHSLLIVENDSVLLDLLTRNFFRCGYNVTPVSHPRLALEAVAARTFDVALLDGRLPEHDGLWLMHELKLRIADLQVVVLSADADPEFRAECLDRGAFAYLRKPCGLAELESAVENAVEHRAEVKESHLPRSAAAHIAVGVKGMADAR